MQAGASVNLVNTTGANGSTPPAAPPAHRVNNGPEYHCLYELMGPGQCWFAHGTGKRPKTAPLCRRSHLADKLSYDADSHTRLLNFAENMGRRTDKTRFPPLKEHLVAQLTDITSAQVQAALQANGQIAPATPPAPASGAASSSAGSAVNVNAPGTPPPTAAQMVWKMLAKESTSHVDVKWVTAYDGYLCHDPTWRDAEDAYTYFNSL